MPSSSSACRCSVGTCSWSKVTTAAAVGDLAQRVEVAVVADEVVGDHLGGGDALGLGEQAQREAERDRRAAAIIRASWPPPMTARVRSELGHGGQRSEGGCGRSISAPGSLGLEAQALAADRGDQLGLPAVVAELAAHPAEVDVDGLRGGPEGRVPDLAHQLVAGDDLAGPPISACTRSNSLRDSTISSTPRQVRRLSGSSRTSCTSNTRDTVGTRRPAGGEIAQLVPSALDRSGPDGRPVSGGGRPPARRCRSRAPAGPGAAGSRTGRRAAVPRWPRR